ncbi:hypothetical protein MBM_00599 [Drepanopeziza brunnea f. sp. 'multigermtubi' MB_m1]|uniref:Uncharacterized protein n=1 Tax=Marssonina brunnea f. sp. multigermtubi (strain MB_m1) TaxID=1072389 RepID=K1X8R1_MARBU|nr:uncharacterized protein MBM_00599 [Drepanopeziza brunnea f. sp. 'multigermtubi' MB_m1]EKD21486.1 hypothetical protein MBM_00599 [Drepanopeziza brunnea f. sp. 'multigermtubi' MB_m1]
MEGLGGISFSKIVMACQALNSLTGGLPINITKWGSLLHNGSLAMMKLDRPIPRSSDLSQRISALLSQVVMACQTPTSPAGVSSYQYDEMGCYYSVPLCSSPTDRENGSPAMMKLNRPAQHWPSALSQGQEEDKCLMQRQMKADEGR